MRVAREVAEGARATHIHSVVAKLVSSTALPFWGWCFAACLGCGERPLEPRDPTPGVAHFRFVSYNVHFTEPRDRGTLTAIARADGDIVGLQETTPAWRDSLAAEFADDYPYLLFYPLEGADGIGLFSRFPVEDHGLLPQPEGWHPAWYLTIETPAGPIELLNVHLRASFDRDGGPVSSLVSTGDDHVEEIRAFTQALDPTLPRIVLGDFNEGVDGKSVEYLEQRGYRNALPLYHPGQPTWIGTSLSDQLELTVDHVMFDGRFAPLDSYVVGRGGSDHFPVVAHLEAARGWGGAP